MHQDLERIGLSIIVVTWNAKQFVQQCLDSIVVAAKYHQSMEIIVVDNNSTDGTPQLIAKQYPAVTLVRNTDNLGFAKATNIGVKEARGEYVCMINSDVVVPEGCLDQMLVYMHEHPTVGLLGPKMIGPDGTAQRSTMRFPTIWNTFCRALAIDAIPGGSKLFGGILMRDFPHDKTMDVEVLNGWFWMGRRIAIDQVGLLDERFFIYGEDIDWCHRFHLAEWGVVFFADVSAIHYGGASSSSAPTRFYVEMQRANLQYWEKHSSWLSVKCFVVNAWLYHIVRIIGHSIIYMFSSMKRAESECKIKNSRASLQWLVGSYAIK